MGKAVDKPIHTYYDLRFERKFVFKGVYLEDLIHQVVFSNSFGFNEIFHRRSVNNIYFDDAAYSFYHQNVAGDGDRKKYRLRWYGDDLNTISDPRMEIKKKYGVIGDKYARKLKGLNLDLKTQTPDAVRLEVVKALEQNGESLLAVDLLRLSPTLINRYERRYFLSACGRFRITLDYNMQFYNPNYQNFMNSEFTLANKETIFELKYKPEFDDECRKLTQRLKNRVSKNSKYVTGIDCISN